MPVFDYHCKSCSRDFDLLRKADQRDEPAKCPVCAEPTTIRKVTAPLRTIQGWATFEYSVSGKFDRGLGQTVYSTKHRDKVAEAKGVVPFEALGQNFVEGKWEKLASAAMTQTKIDKKYDALVQKYGGDQSEDAHIKAQLEVFKDDDIIDNKGDFADYMEAEKIIRGSEEITNNAAEILSGSKIYTGE
jgi:putative FmdB family regulatory protein